ncbi:hypothetical protein PCIT_a4159 [Pseudoalteromonas citrea]|uniref:Beta-lactamase-related domain-containing protein n=2 Tax=Pseudoalteromonas citrea TaxID=43655 RepID=A0AAD4AIU1_9GAMM|nr:serine hydrolase [Pseudoalteromonas citrea]KAF7771549.1 hypothetical protein PCIT_a4159 [Pseudoalteromonas citrea]
MFVGKDIYSYGDGGQVSSVNDLISFSQAINEYKLISKDTHLLMAKKHTVISENATYGYGTKNNIIAHDGAIDGFRTAMYIDPERDFYLHILSNGGDQTEKHINEIIDLIGRFVHFP